MCQLAKDQRKMLLVETRKAAERVIQEALRQLEEPPLISCAGSAGTSPCPGCTRESLKPVAVGC